MRTIACSCSVSGRAARRARIQRSSLAPGSRSSCAHRLGVAQLGLDALDRVLHAGKGVHQVRIEVPAALLVQELEGLLGAARPSCRAARR